MTAYLQGMSIIMAAKYIKPKRSNHPRWKDEPEDREGCSTDVTPKKKRDPDAIPRYPIKVSVGCTKGKEHFVTVKVSLNQLKEAARRMITGNGGYLETVERVRQFKDGSLLPNE